MTVPIFCFDVDGTLVDEQGVIHPADVALLGAEPPAALFIPCTGRPLEGLRRTFAQFGLFVSSNIPLPLVLQNGALIYLPGEVQLAYLTSPPAYRMRCCAWHRRGLRSASYSSPSTMYISCGSTVWGWYRHGASGSTCSRSIWGPARRSAR